MLLFLGVAAAAMFVGPANAGVLDATNCGSSATIVSIVASGCEAHGCTYTAGDVAHLEIDFIPKFNSDVLTTEVYGFFSGVKRKFEDVPGDACPTTDRCPLGENKGTIYTMDVEIKPEYPKVRTTAQWNLVDANGEKVVCFEIPVNIE